MRRAIFGPTRRSAFAVLVAVVVAVVVTTGVLFYVSHNGKAHHGGDVVTIKSYGGIGPTREFHRGYHPFDAGFAALPDTMPEAKSDWDPQCGQSGWELIYRNGDHRYYTGCDGSEFPAVLQTAACELSGFEPPAAGQTVGCGSRKP